MKVRQTLTKDERLHENTVIGRLFNCGEKRYISSFNFYSLIIDNPDSECNTKVQFIVVAKKKQFKRAVDRNRIKRIIRDIFRKNKFIFDECPKFKGKQLLLAIIYVGKQIPDYTKSEKTIISYFKLLTTYE